MHGTLVRGEAIKHTHRDYECTIAKLEERHVHRAVVRSPTQVIVTPAYARTQLLGRKPQCRAIRATRGLRLRARGTAAAPPPINHQQDGVVVGVFTYATVRPEYVPGLVREPLLHPRVARVLQAIQLHAGGGQRPVMECAHAHMLRTHFSRQSGSCSTSGARAFQANTPRHHLLREYSCTSCVYLPSVE